MSLTILGLLVLLDEIAATTAACSGEVDETAALEVILLTEVGALESERDPVKTEAGRTPEEQALLTGYVSNSYIECIKNIQRC